MVRGKRVEGELVGSEDQGVHGLHSELQLGSSVTIQKHMTTLLNCL